MNGQGDLKAILRDVGAGNRDATDRLFTALYAELRQLAGYHLSHERPNHTLQPTALINEVYVRFAGSPRLAWNDQLHFLALASRAMRHILVDHARGRLRAKRSGGRPHLPLEENFVIGPADGPLDLLALDQAISRLEKEEPEKAQVVVMRFFGGMTEEEIGAVLSLTPRTVRRYWAYAQARLYEELTRAAD